MACGFVIAPGSQSCVSGSGRPGPVTVDDVAALCTPKTNSPRNCGVPHWIACRMTSFWPSRGVASGHNSPNVGSILTPSSRLIRLWRRALPQGPGGTVRAFPNPTVGTKAQFAGGSYGTSGLSCTPGCDTASFRSSRARRSSRLSPRPRIVCLLASGGWPFDVLYWAATLGNAMMTAPDLGRDHVDPVPCPPATWVGTRRR